VYGGHGAPMETLTCGCGEEHIPGLLAKGMVALVLTGLAVMAVMACVLTGVVWAFLRWRDRGHGESEQSFFDGFGRWEEEEGER
jgi:hypothetical protein